MLLGDLYYHGPRNPLTEEYNPKEVANILNKYTEKILAVKGNCDAEVDEMISNFKMQDKVSFYSEGVNMLFTHGHKINIDNMPNNISNLKILCYGHFHTGFIKEKDGVIIFNPGSISMPKDNTRHSYGIIENGEIYLKDVSGGVIESKKF